jgi:hypothetical protein
MPAAGCRPQPRRRVEPVSDHLRDLAEKAHAEYPSAWHTENPGDFPEQTMVVYGWGAHDFISACDPQTILNLLDERDRYRAALEDIAQSVYPPAAADARDALNWLRA